MYRNENSTHMYIPGSDEVVDVLKHMSTPNYITGIEPGTKGLFQLYEGGIITYTVCNMKNKETLLRVLPYPPYVLILETPLVCGKMVKDTLAAAYEFEVS